MSTYPLRHDYVVTRVDELVNNILSPNTRISIQQISKQLNLYYQPMTLFYNDELKYTASIEWFIGSCYLVCGKYNPSEVVWDEAMTTDFVHVLRLYQPEFAKAISDFASQEQRNSNSLYDYMSHYLNQYARVLIVRVDLKMRQKYSNLVDVETFNNYMNQLMIKVQRGREKEKKRKARKLANISKDCFEDLRGYAWAVEQGVENGGLHCHLLLIYNGDKRHKDWSLGDAVGRKWIEITNGLGRYYNCNDTEHKNFYEAHGLLGIGMIHKSNELEKDNAMRAALYLTRPEKYEQRLKAWTPNMRTFGHGNYCKTKRRGDHP